MTSSVKNYDTVDTEKFNFTKPEKFNNSYFGAMSYGDNSEPIYIQTPKLRCKQNIKDVLDNKQPYLEVIIPKNKLDFYDLFINIDDRNIFFITRDLDNALTLNDRAIKTNQRQRYHLVLTFLLVLFQYP